VNTLNGAVRTLRLVHAALVVSLGSYLVLLFVTTRQPRAAAPQTFEQISTMFYILLAIGGGVLASLPAVRGWLMPPRRRAERIGDGSRTDRCRSRLNGRCASWSPHRS
jgi:hypothetical protein